MEPKPTKQQLIHFDAWGQPVGLTPLDKDLFNADKTAKDGPQGGPSFTSGSGQRAEMPGSSTADGAVYNAMGGKPNEGYDTYEQISTTREGSWGLGVFLKKLFKGRL